MAEETRGPLVPELQTTEAVVAPRLYVWRPKGQQGILCVSLSRRLLSYGTHYIPQLTRDKGCRGKHELCHWCRDGYDFREKHYLAALLPSTGRVGLLELTAGAVRHCPQLRDASRNWRGVQVKAWRLASKGNSPERVQVGSRQTDLALPPEPDVYAELLRYWGEANHSAAAEGGPPL